MPVRFANTRTDRLPVSMAGVTPEGVAGASLDALRRTVVRHGNRPATLGELFAISGNGDDLVWHFEGDCSAVHSVGAGMTRGTIQVEGPIGRHAGAGMRGGRIEVHGPAGDFLGSEMSGGSIHVRGDAGDYVGAPNVPGNLGMRGGTILVHGSAGRRVGERMRRGLIAIAGAVGESLGHRMIAGTLLAFGAVGAQVGAGMRRGAIGLFGPRPALPPTCRLAYRGPLPMLALIQRELAAANFAPPQIAALTQPVELHHCDLLELARGEILLPAPN